ncbi:hypothetical protein [Reyranella sp.]|uniref:hypothetical protein n=1 Tax=Reyranella sp. TaxID=1929291 RepID=UPI003BAA2035
MEVYLPGAGWVEFDPTNGIIGSDRLIRVAVARNPEQAMPIKGTFTGPADVVVTALVDVQVRTLVGPDIEGPRLEAATPPAAAPVQAADGPSPPAANAA